MLGTAFNGIDFIEVSDDQLILTVVFVNSLPGEAGGVPVGPPLTSDNLQIDGGVRVTNIGATLTATAGNQLTVTVSSPGDFSIYSFRLVTSAADDTVPPGFDPQLSAIDFSFKVGCPSEFDCKQDEVCPPETAESADIDYLAKDYATFRRLMLDHMSSLIPGFRDPNVADLQSAVVETLAYVADRLSYFQDAVATEAYLGTARLRQSVRRHARLLDYFVSEGCNSRAWLCFETAAGQDGSLLDIGTPIFAAPIGSPPTLALVEFEKLGSATTVFELMHPLTLREARNRIPFYTWSDEDCCLPSGSTTATLVNDPDLQLVEGDVLVLEEIAGPTSGLAQDADRDHRHAVRLIDVNPGTDPITGAKIVDVTWHPQDALRFPLCLSAEVTGSTGTSLVAISVARGNVALADHGRRLAGQPVEPEVVPDDERYRPLLVQRDITFASPYEHESTPRPSAASATLTDPRTAKPLLELQNLQGNWNAQRDLLSSSRFALDFVAETMTDRTVQLRFGDDVLGAKPREGSVFSANLRFGNGRSGNVGAERLSCLVANQPLIDRVWNPLPATGGVDPEPIVDVKRDAPVAFRTQQRAVTAQDWADKALAFTVNGVPGVQRAVAEFRWTGSWYTVFLTVDRTGGLGVANDEAFKTALLAYLERFRIAGYDLELRDPIFVALELRLFVCAKAGYFQSQIKQRVLEVLSNRSLADGRRGLFHPDNFSFGQSVFLSQIVAAVEAVDGVDSVEVQAFQRWGKTAAGELKRGFITMGPREVALLSNDPNFAEQGVIEVTVKGGI